MPQSLSKIYVHTVFSTKNRESVLTDPALRAELHAYLGGIAKQKDCFPVIIGGAENHVHLLTTLGRSISISELVKELKRVSSAWLHEKGISEFKWQAGYASFSVSQSNVEKVTDYIANQEEHHKKVSFQDELRAFFEKHEIDFDEQYVWD